MAEIREIVAEVNKCPVDRNSIPQPLLNVENKKRTSVFPWRGQFTPKLIEILLTYYSHSDAVVLDPFAGSGTVLFEAARKRLECYGTEINPAAIEIAKLSQFVNIKIDKRVECIRRARDTINRVVGDGSLPSFIDNKRQHSKKSLSFEEAFVETVKMAPDEQTRTLIICTFMRSIGSKSKDLFDAFAKQVKVVREMPYSPKPCRPFLCDARALPFEDESIDLVITSPPYINVFNYHQNYRRLMELLGWNILYIAKSEIGSNRKHRQNRFLTVIQYCLDMLQALCEMRRIIKPDGRVIIVIGRESKIRGISFENYKILSALAIGGGFKLICRQERGYINRFGERITEDIIHLIPVKDEKPKPDYKLASDIAKYFLEDALNKAEGDIKEDIASAISQVNVVHPSPILRPEKARKKEQLY